MAKGISVPVTATGLDASISNAVKKVGAINIPVNVDPSAFKNLAQPLGRVSGLATEFEKSIAASNARVLAFGASVGIINGVQNAFASLLQTGIEVQKTLAEIAAISGQSGEALAKFGDSLFEVGKLTGQSFKTAAQAALEFSRQGLSTEETLKRTSDALTLTRFTTLNAAEAVDVLTAAANSFGDTGITTTEILNKLVAVDTKFAVSAEDLANGLARAGSIAQEVGVSFDELNAAITVAQERTARGGSVIGNALKTIFTRLRSDETVQALRSIGVESLNAQGGLKGAIPLLEEVAQKLQGLSEGERVQILEAIASKYNINILSAILTDLSDANKKFGQVVGISAGAGNQAYERQIELNKALAAQINVTTVSVEQLFNKLAEIGVTESLGNLLKFVNGLLDGINKILDSESTGGNIARGLIKGISDVFFTIGLPLIGAIFIKLTKDIAQFGVESLKTILGINQQVRERQALEQAVVNTLIRDQEIMATILSLSGNRAKQEEYLLSVYNRQLAALQQVQSIAAGVAPALQAAGLSATSGTVKRRAAEGYLPAAEARDVRRGVGGASPSSKVVEIPNFSFGGGKRGTMVANTSEYIVPNYAGGSGTAIFNQDMAKEYGLPPGAKKITASGGFVPVNGFIPNFVEKKFNVFDQKRAKVKKDQEPIDYVDLDGMRRSAYLTLDASIDPVGRFSKLQSSAQQKLTEKLGPIAENAKIVPDQGSIEFVQINKSLQRDDLVQKIRETKNKIQANPKAKIDKDIEDIVQSILPETKGSVDNNLKAAVKTELQVQGPAAFRSGNVLEDILFKKITGTIEGRNSKTWDLPAEQSGAFKSRFGFKSEFGDIKLGSSTSSISSFIGKHIISPTGQNASGGYIPNFARYVYDADRVDADKNNLLKAILASRVKKNLIVGPAGSGKSTYGESLGSFITNIAQLTDASEIDILSGAARTKDGGVSKNFQQISDAVNASGGKISYLYTGNMDILSRRTGRIAEGPKQGDLRSKKQIVGTMFAPLNQFDFISKVKGSAKNFEMIRGAKGYVPNFADKKPATIKGGKVDRKTYMGPRALVSAEGIAGMIVPDQDNQETMTNYLKENPWGFQTKEDVYLPPENSLITNVKYNTYGLNEKAFEGQALKKSGTQTLIEADVEKAGIEIAKKWATKYSDEYAKKMPGRSVKTNYDENFIRTSFTASEGAVSAISTLGGGIFESSIRAALDTQVGQRIEKAQKEDSNNRLDFPVNPFLKELFNIEGGEQFVDAKISGSPGSTGRKLADQIVAAGLYRPVRTIKTAAAEGYIPNFASQNAIDAMRRIISDPAAPQGEKDAAASKLAQVTKVTSSGNPRATAQKIVKTKLPITQEDKDYLNQNKEKIIAGMGRSFGMLFNLDALEMGDLNYVKRLDPSIAKKLSEIVQKQGGRDSVRSLIDFGSAARGYIPNFADNEPLKEALNREVAAGVPPARVRVTQDERLKNPKNPNGLAVINTRDEPNGKIPNNFRKRVARQEAASTGFVPNFAGKIQSPSDIRRAEDRAVKQGRASYLSDKPSGATPDEGVKVKTEAELDKFSESVSKAAEAANKGSEAADKQAKSTSSLDATILKSTAVFGALTSASYILQETLAKTDSGILLFAKGLTDAAQKASLGLTLGEGFKPVLETLGDKLPGAMGRFATQLSSVVPVVGAFSGALFGLYQFLDELGTRDKRAGEQRADKFIENTQALDTKGSIDVVEKRIQELANRTPIADLNARKETGRVIASTMFGGAGAGGFGYQSGPLTLTEAEKKEEEESQKALGERIKLEEFLKKLKEKAAAEQGRAASQQQKENEEVRKRISLSESLASINEAFAAGQNKNLIDRASKQANLIKLSYKLTESQKEEQDLQQKLQGIENQRLDLRNELFNRALNEIANSSKLANVDQQSVKNLVERVKNGEKIENLQTEFLKLGAQGALVAEEVLKKTTSTLTIEDAKLATQKLTTEQIERANIALSNQLKIEELRSRILDDNFKSNRDIENSILRSTRTLDEAKSRTPVAILENRIASQPFATREQEYELARLKDQFEKLSAQRKIDTDFAEAQKNSFERLQDSVKSSVDGLKALEQGFRNGNAQIIRNAENVDQVRVVLDNLIEKRKELTATQGADSKAVAELNLAIQNIQNSFSAQNIEVENARQLQEEYNKQLQRSVSFQLELLRLRKENPFAAGILTATNELKQEVQGFDEKLGKEMTLGFRDGLRDALGAAISQTDDLNTALQNVATNFLKRMQDLFLQDAANNLTLGIKSGLSKAFSNDSGASAQAGLSSVFKSIGDFFTSGPSTPRAAKGGYIKGYATGGLVSGGSGYKDDVPAMLSEGEYVIRKSSVNKYGASNLSKLNSGQVPKFAAGGIFLPGVRGGTAISGYKDLTAFANQTTTSGATDVLMGSGSTAFANLEDQSARLSRFALLNEDDIVNQEVRSAQEQALNIMAEREAYRTAQRKAFQKQLKQTVVAAALNFGIGKLSSMAQNAQAAKAAATAAKVDASLKNFFGPMDLPQMSVQTSAASGVQLNTLGMDFLNPQRVSQFASTSPIQVNNAAVDFLSNQQGASNSAFYNTGKSQTASDAVSSINYNLKGNQPLSRNNIPQNIIQKSRDYATTSYLGVPAMDRLPTRTAGGPSSQITNFYTNSGLSQPLTPSLQRPLPFSRRPNAVPNTARQRFSTGVLGKAYGGIIQRYNSGGGPTDDIPALLMGGEYVMSRQSTKKYGKQFFDSINQGRAPRFADGGQTSTSEPSFAEKASSSAESKSSNTSNVTININVTGGTSETQTQGETKQGSTDYKKMGEQIKQIVIQTINEEKRLGGSLRPRG